MNIKYLRIVTFSVALILPATLAATNGMNMTAYGARYAGMGGAALAVGGSVMDIASNPAFLSAREEAALEGGFAFLNPTLKYEDFYYNASNPELSYSNNIKSEPNVMPIPYIGYAAPITENLGWGIAVYGHGGMGAEFNGINRYTPGKATLSSVLRSTFRVNEDLPYIGNSRLLTENTYSNLAVAKVSPAIAYKMGKFKIGLALDANIAQMEWRWTFSDPGNIMEMPGAGYRYKSDTAYALAGKVGLAYDVTDNWTVAYTYNARTKLYFNGDMTVNEGSPAALHGDNRFFKPLDVSMYLEFPESHGVGIAWSNGAWTVALDVEYVKWASVMNTISFTMSQPWAATPIGNPINDLAFTMKWRDTTVYALGFEYKPESVAYRMGYNFANSPVTEDGVNPLFPAITEHHIFAGLGFTWDRLTLDLAIEYAFPNTVKGGDMSDWEMFHALHSLDATGVQNPGYNYQVTMSQVTPHIGIKYTF